MSTPISYLSSNVGTSPVAIFTAANTNGIMSAQFTNRVNATILADLYVTRAGLATYFVKNLEMSANASVTVIGDGKHILLNNDVLNVVSDTAASLDVIVSGAMGVQAV